MEPISRRCPWSMLLIRVCAIPAFLAWGFIRASLASIVRPPGQRPESSWSRRPTGIREWPANLPLQRRPERPAREAPHSRQRPGAQPPEPPTYRRRTAEKSDRSGARPRGQHVRSIVCLPSHPIGSDPGTGSEPLGDWRHRPQGPIQNPVEAVQGEPVDDLFASAFGLHESAMPKTREMCGDTRLRLLDRIDQLCNRALMVLKELEDPEPGRIAQDPEETSRRGSTGRS